MFAIRPGRIGPPRNLDEMLRSRWEQHRETNNEELKRRKALGVPLDDGDGPLVEIGEYESNENYRSIFVTMRSVSRREIMETDIRIKEISESVESKSEAVEKLRSDLETFEAMKEFCRLAVVKVGGFKDEDGEYSIEGADGLSQEQVEFLDECGLLFPIFACAKSFQYLEPEEKKLFGLQAPLTSQTPRSIADNAQNKEEGYSVVTGTPPVNGSSLQDMKATHVQEGYQSVTIG